MTEPRDPYDELYEVILQALVHSPTTNGMLGRADAVTDAVYAAYPQLAATELHVLRATTWNADGTPTPRRRTVYATPWEDA